MKTTKAILILVLASTALSAQKQELALTLGGVLGSTRSGLDLGVGTALGANYAYRLGGGERASLYGEVEVLASPLRDVATSNAAATRDFASLYVTPGVRVKFAPGGAFAPFLTVGGGYALYEQSTSRIDGQPNNAPRLIHRGAFTVGGGVDVRFWRWLGFRGEIRDFYTGSPAFNLPLRGGQHNVIASGGMVLKWN